MSDSTPSTPSGDEVVAPRPTIEDTGSTVDAAELVPDDEEEEAPAEEADRAT